MFSPATDYAALAMTYLSVKWDNARDAPRTTLRIRWGGCIKQQAWASHREAQGRRSRLLLYHGQLKRKRRGAWPRGPACVWSVTQSYSTLCDPLDCSPPDSSVHGILQARMLERVAISSSRGSFQPRDRTHISCIGRWVLYHQESQSIQLSANNS